MKGAYTAVVASIILIAATTAVRSGQGDPSDRDRIPAAAQKEIENFTQQADICEELAQRKAAGGP